MRFQVVDAGVNNSWGVVVEELVVQVLEALYYAWFRSALCLWQRQRRVRRTSLVFIVAQGTVVDAVVVLLYGADVVMINCASNRQ